MITVMFSGMLLIVSLTNSFSASQFWLTRTKSVFLSINEDSDFFSYLKSITFTVSTIPSMALAIYSRPIGGKKPTVFNSCLYGYIHRAFLYLTISIPYLSILLRLKNLLGGAFDYKLHTCLLEKYSKIRTYKWYYGSSGLCVLLS